MTQERRVESVARDRVGSRGDWWAVAYVLPDGSRVRHSFPPEALHCRAAEYGIDPTDAHTLLDTILHEHHVTGHTHESPDFVYNTDRETARKALYDRIEDVKTRHLVVDPEGLLDQIREAHVHDPARHAEMSALVDHIRNNGTIPHRSPDNG